MPVKTPYYESRFVRANHPDEPLALWLRETLLLPTALAPVADVWVMVFDPDGAGNRALKVGYPIGSSDYRYEATGGTWTARIGDTTIDDVCAQGAITGDGRSAAWNLSIAPGDQSAVKLLTERGIPGAVPHRQDDGSASARDVRRAGATRRRADRFAALDWKRQSQLGQTPHVGLCIRAGVRFRWCTRREPGGRHCPRRRGTHLAAGRDAVRITARWKGIRRSVDPRRASYPRALPAVLLVVRGSGGGR